MMIGSNIFCNRIGQTLINCAHKLGAMLNHLVHRAVLQEFSITIAIHAILFVLASIGICTENLVSQWHSATLTKFDFFHIIHFFNIPSKFDKSLQFFVEHLRLLHVDEVSASGQFRIVKVGI